jgi:hypothetical protein
VSTRRSSLLVVLLVGGALGLAGARLDLWLDCRRPASEACVWGRAFATVSLTLGALVGIALALLAHGALRAWRRRSSAGQDAP